MDFITTRKNACIVLIAFTTADIKFQKFNFRGNEICKHIQCTSFFDTQLI